MNRNKGAENTAGKKENEESKIPKSTKFSTAKEKTSKAPVEKRAAQNWKTTIRLVAMQSSKQKQTQIAKLPKNVKPMSLIKMSKDVMNHLQTENLKSDDPTTENAARAPILDKENITKRVLLKEKSSQTSQKQSGSLPKKPSASDLKKSTAYGGMKFTAKRTCQKSDVFQKLKKESKKDCQDMHPAEPGTRRRTKTDSAKPMVSKDLERLNNGNLENIPTNEAESSKAASLALNETAPKNFTAFGSIRFAPKWKSTPLKPDLFEKIPQEFKHGDEDLFSTDSSPKLLEMTPDFTKVIIREKTEIETETVTVDETVQPRTKEVEYLATASITINETGNKIYTAFAGMHLTPKRKSTHQKPDIFENLQKESKNDDQELHSSGTSTEQMKMSSVATKPIIKTETQRSQIEKLKQSSTQKTESLETVTITMKETSHTTAYGGIRFAPKWKSTPIRPDMIDRIQKEFKTDDLESYPTESFSKELKKIPDSTKTIIKVKTQQSNVEKLEVPSTQKPESSKNDVVKNVKEADSKPLPTFAGLRLKPRQKNRRDVFEARKTKIDNQAQS